jgi:hypothetical protein
MKTAFLSWTDVAMIKLYAYARAEMWVPKDGKAHRLGDYIKMDDYRHGIRRYFQDTEGFEEWMVDILFKEFQGHEQLEEQARVICSTFIGGLYG